MFPFGCSNRELATESIARKQSTILIISAVIDAVRVICQSTALSLSATARADPVLFGDIQRRASRDARLKYLERELLSG
jgi:hypothetical protein